MGHGARTVPARLQASTVEPEVGDEGDGDDGSNGEDQGKEVEPPAPAYVWTAELELESAEVRLYGSSQIAMPLPSTTRSPRCPIPCSGAAQ